MGLYTGVLWGSFRGDTRSLDSGSSDPPRMDVKQLRISWRGELLPMPGPELGADQRALEEDWGEDTAL